MIQAVKKTNSGEAPIMPSIILAAYMGNYKLVEQLLKKGVDVNSVDPRDNLTCLHIGCMQCDEELVNVILERERTHGDVDFTIKSRYRPRLAWQCAVGSDWMDMAHKVFLAGQKKSRTRSSSFQPA